MADLESSSWFCSLSFKHSYLCSAFLLEVSVSILSFASVGKAIVSDQLLNFIPRRIGESFWSPDTIFCSDHLSGQRTSACVEVITGKQKQRLFPSLVVLDIHAEDNPGKV